MRSNNESLREEYKGCIEKIGRLDNLIWQTASVILPITLAGLAYFGSTDKHTPDQFYTLLAVGTGSTTMIMSWYMLSRTWYSYQLVAFYRIREIEAELGLWHYRYSLFLRNPKKKRMEMLNKMNKSEKARFQKLEEQHDHILRIGLRSTITILMVVFVFGWFTLITREYILIF